MTSHTSHTDEEINAAAARFEAWAETLDRTQLEDIPDLRALAEASEGVRAGNARVRELVELARARGRSWGQIGLALGVSRQAARERFSEKTRA